jgi:type IV secretory pathway VirB2 component (pilin)
MAGCCKFDPNQEPAPAFAAGSSMPWRQPLRPILQSIDGPVSRVVAVIIIMGSGLAPACPIVVMFDMLRHRCAPAGRKTRF